MWLVLYMIKTGSGEICSDSGFQYEELRGDYHRVHSLITVCKKDNYGALSLYWRALYKDPNWYKFGQPVDVSFGGLGRVMFHSNAKVLRGLPITLVVCKL